MHLVSFERREDRRGERAGTRPFASGRTASMGDAAFDYESLEEMPHGVSRLGALLPHGSRAGDIVDLNRALAIKLAFEDVGAPEAAADSLLPSNAMAFLAHLPDSLAAGLDALAFVLDSLERYDAPDILRAGVVESLRRVRLLPAVPRPGKILALECNYPVSRRGSQSANRPAAPSLFLEASSSLIGPGDEIVLPANAGHFKAAGALAVVIGQRACKISPDEALDYVAGYCIANDVAPSDLGDDGDRLHIGRSRDTFTPLGPSLVTADEVPDPQDLSIRTSVSQESVQSAGTKEMIFPVSELIAHASGLVTLEPGDVILTGSPPASSPGAAARRLRDGDVVEVEIDRLGRLRNYVRETRSFAGT